MMIFQPPKGMRDWAPAEAAKLNWIMDTVRSSFEKYGFMPLQTPAVESFELLSAKGGLGEAVKDEIYYFKDKSDREIGLRFDLTMSLMRFVLSNQNMPRPFKRWQMGCAWRYDNPQAMRYREFIQADVDIVGAAGPMADAELLAAAVDALRALGFDDFKVRISNRKLTEAVLEKLGVPKAKMADVFRSIDKRSKISDDDMRKELKDKAIDAKIIGKIFDFIGLYGDKGVLAKLKKGYGNVAGLDELTELFAVTEQYGIGKWLALDMSLVRGLDYYTGLVYEVAIGDKKIGAGGGGRYDNLVKSLGGQATPATGISLGISRLFGIAEELGMLKDMPTAKVFVAPVNDDVRSDALKIVKQLRDQGVACETDLLNKKLGKQLEYAAALKIPYVAIVGPEELKQKSVKLRDMASGKEQILKKEKIKNAI